MAIYPLKESEYIPWDIFLVDLISPYNIRKEVNNNPLKIKYLTMTYPETFWFEII